MANGVMQIELDGERILVDPTDINGVEWRAIKAKTGLTPKKAFEAAQEMDFEAIAAFVWTVKSRDEADLDYEAVLSGLSVGSFVAASEDDEDPSV